ncbi:MAG: hypothetical protein HS113_26650 [Verrucomicrobiales bacterium]|nr:hypothetical protein [Verrucomicrobiales bacterium]
MKALSEIVRDEAGVKVLSFGCSSGEEVLDIRQYYRHATVFGTDLNRKSLKKAQRLLRGTGVQLFVSTDENIQEHGPYTLIMACSVFIRHPEDTHTDDISTLYPFEVFERGICRLFENTIVGGYLLIHNADYRVTDTRVGPRLRPVRHGELVQNPRVPLFARTGRKLGVTGYDEQLFRRES